MVVLPQFDQPLNTLVLSFNYQHGNHSSGYNVQLVAITNLNDPDTYTVVKEICNASESISSYSTASDPYTIRLYECPNAPSSSTPRLAIRYSETSSDGDSWYMDNFSVAISHTLTVQSSPTAGGSATAGSTTIVENGTTTITATPNTGYVFTGWTVSGTGASVADDSSPSTTFTMGTTNATVTANFEELGVFITSTPASTECLAPNTQVVLTASTNVPMPAGNYSFEVASGSYSAISGTSSVSGDDSYSSAINIGFTFNYWGVDYTTAVIATNGFLKLGNGSNSYSNDLASSSYYNYLAAFWDDLDATSTKYTTIGTEPNRVFVMEHNGYRHGDSGYTFSFQIKLYETTNVIEFCYGSGFPNVASSNTSASIGLNNRADNTTSFISVTPSGVGTATTSTTSANNSIGTTQCDYLTSGTIYRFTPPTPNYIWTANGTQGTANGDTYTVSPTQNSTYTVSLTIDGQTYTETASVTVKPAVPTDLTVSNITSTTTTVTWNANGASSWQYSIDNGSTWTNVNTNSVNLTGLTLGQSYTFKVKAVSGDCESSVASCTVTTSNTFTLTYNANGGSGTMTDPDSPYNYGSTVTVLANSFTAPSDYVFNCWNTAADGSGTKYVAVDTFTITANTTLYAQWAPLVIANTTQWDEFAAAVNSGFNYNGLTVTMTDNVETVTTIVGTSGNLSFQGTFDGQCHTLTINYTSTAARCAPFHTADNATFMNLRIAGTMSVSHFPSGALVGYVHYGCHFINCVSDVEITATASDAGNNGLGGFLGEADRGSNPTIYFEGCTFTGKLIGNCNGWGGFVGRNRGYVSWSSSNSDIYFTDCVFAPVAIPSSTSGCATFARSDSYSSESNSHIHINNCYYTQVLGQAQGMQCYTITPGSNTTVALTGTMTGHNYAASCSGTGLVFYDNEDSNSTFDNGFSYNNGSTTTLYAAGNVTTNLLLGATTPANSTFFYYSATPGSLSGNAATGTNDPYTLTMTAANQTITANYVNQTTSTDWTTAVSSMPSSGISIGNPTNISNANGLAWFISMVNGLNGEDGNDFSSYIINLTADVDMSAHTWVPIGTVEHPFSGTFNGNGHVIKGITRSTDFPHDGLFGYVSGSANIQNVVVQASLTGNSHATGAVVGTFASTGTISNVEGAGTLTGGALTTALGGIAGNNSGMLHSSFAVATMTGGASATQMGGLVGNNTGDLLNSYSNATYAGTSAPKGGLVGSNSGTVENCYAAGIASGVSAFAGSNSGTIQYCYTDAVGSGYIGTNSTAPTGSGTYGAVQSSIKHLNYMYRDNLITKNTNSYVGTKDAIADGIDVYVDKHIPVWNGLVSALNQWVKEKNQVSDASSLYYNKDFTAWHRPLTTHINGDLPVLGFAKDNSLGTLDSDGKFLQYGSNQNGGNGLDVVLTTFNNSTASIFHYGKATGVTHVPTANVNVFINEDAVLLQATSPDPGAFINTTVGVTFDNSDHGTHAYDYWGNKLDYDWHFLSTPLSDAKIGATYNDYVAHGYGSDIDIKTLVNCYFPNNLPMALHDANWRWDFYTYYEPEYHWINLKRNKNNHYHVDGGWSISYTYNADDQAVGDEASLACVFTPGKGYMMAISKDVFMNSTGTLNRGNVPIRLTLKEPDDINYASGWNLVGNPYQAYLNINALNRNLYIYDADQGVYAPYAPAASDNPATPSQYIHPHQAFFVHAASDGEELIFTPTMASTETTPYSYYRDDRIDYPLVNLYAENNAGQRDLIVVEFHRPELGGARKLETMRNAPFTLAAHYAGISYGILFATDDIERIPVRFKTDENGWVTLTWNTHNGEFSKLLLIDNKLGVEHNMLADNSYTFEASPDDYSSRFYIVYDCSGMGVEENEESGASTGSATAATFAYINNGNIDIDIGSGHGASIQVIDVLGRVLYSKTIAGTDGTCTVSTKGLAKGVYLIRLADGHNVKTQKLVVQ